MLQDGGWTALHFAASNGHLDVVKYLCWKGGKEMIMAMTTVSGPDDPEQHTW
jgi:ankyrin repeat protein